MWYILLCIPKYILTFAAVLVTLNYSLMKYKVSYEDRAGQVFSFTTSDAAVHHLIELLALRQLQSIIVSYIEQAQKGGQYEQQPE